MSCTGCQSVKALLDQATLLAPHRSRASDGVCASRAHHAQNPSSDHEADSRGIAHACDLTHDPAGGCDAHWHAERVRLRVLSGAEHRIRYIISNRRIFNPSVSPAWRPYTGVNPHEHHAHFSVLRTSAAENDVSWWFASASPPAQGDEFDMASLDDLRKIVREELAVQARAGVVSFGDVEVVGLNYIWRLDPPPARGRWYISLAARSVTPDTSSGYVCFLREDGAHIKLKEWSFTSADNVSPTTTLDIGEGDNDANRVVAVCAFKTSGSAPVSVTGVWYQAHP